MAEGLPVSLDAREVGRTFTRDTGEQVTALANVSFQVSRGSIAALVGPDGSGKTTFLRIAAGLVPLEHGSLTVLGLDVSAEPQAVQERIGYMPQRFGLYEDLSVQENLDLYADMHGISMDERGRRYPRLMEMTALGEFRTRLAGDLSGGMKQKLGLACTLVRSPELLILDEPTVGVDPLSRREFWEIILQLVEEESLTVLISTSYHDEAERCGNTIVLYDGAVIARGTPDEITAHAMNRTWIAAPPGDETAGTFQARLFRDAAVLDAVPEGGRVRIVMRGNASPSPETLRGALLTQVPPRFEDGFMVAVYGGRDKPTIESSMTFEGRARSGLVVEVNDLSRRFGSFTAVDRISFSVGAGEVFGLLGPNGAGKTTTFRMLCGLLPASGGSLKVAGLDLRYARASARQHIGYVAQKFSLYGTLTVYENLEFFASVYGLRGARKRERTAWAVEQFELGTLAELPSEQLPGGYRQRLAMAAALLHEPDILFLDEATSGADPLARREFWGRINELAQQGVTVVITTHFMEEAEYCDRVMIMDAGRMLAQGTSAKLRERGRPASGREATMEDAFVAIVEDSRREHGRIRA